MSDRCAKCAVRALVLAVLVSFVMGVLPVRAGAVSAFDVIVGGYLPDEGDYGVGIIGRAARNMARYGAGDFPITILVNRSNPVPQGLEPELVGIGNGMSVDKRCYDDLMLMLEDCRAAGLEPVVCSAYRTHEYQTQLYENKISRLIAEGVDAQQAPTLAMTVVALPGTSEHQLGLALDIVDASYQLLDEEQQHTAVQRWLMDNSYRYGFILRYPVDKSAVTGIIYEPWHYRYVGREVAQLIYESGLCMEEFVELHPDVLNGTSPLNLEP